MDPILTSLPYLGALITLGLGLFGLLYPRGAVSMIGLALNPDLRHSISEIRATYGGLFIGAAAYTLATGAATAFIVLGMAWVGTGLARVFSMLLDKAVTRINLMATAMELVIGILFLAPHLR